ncbi:hypothetical protein [Microbacterium excoecariae]|uniref:hypothetical protein n=1 Tax=Microbacterium excoecariae TaxID=2715210 RepID=UPI001407BB21|nr:hypothetical protein [Microbacterium excoecariae]NHI15794.1 hypothetical protein [Microbacterium excoecariae]
MVSLLVDSELLEVQLAPLERRLALRKDPLRIPRAAIARVQLTDDPFTWIRGVRAPGTHVPNRLAYGTWKSVFGDDFLAVRPGRPGVVIDLADGEEFQRVVLSTKHGLALARALQRDEEREAGEVTELT